jgi:hypothetical protein
MDHASLRTELMGLAAVLGETRPRFQKFGHARMAQLRELSGDLRRLATEIEAGIEAEIEADQRMAARLNGHRNGHDRNDQDDG